MSRKRRWLKRLTIASSAILAVLLAFVLAGIFLARASLPKVSGEIAVSGPSAQVQVERDARGIVTVRASDEYDCAFGLGFAHAQDRRFQMDLLRRAAAGELAEVAGPAVVSVDQNVRFHQLRRRAKRIVETSSEDDRRLLDAYARGVNAGYESLNAKPIEFQLLGTAPPRWTPEDSILVLYTMFLDLQGQDHKLESTWGILNKAMPAPVYEFLLGPSGWEAPLDDEGLSPLSIPGSDVIDFRRNHKIASAHDQGNAFETQAPFDDPSLSFAVGSNNWAVSGKLTVDGRALVANDMHLGLSVPNLWYRARLAFAGPTVEGKPQEIEVTGATLPGTPVMIVGSNRHVAWGFTNAYGDWSDLIDLEINPRNPEQYRTPDGWREFETETETLLVKGQEPETMTVKKTIWGPVHGVNPFGQPQALRWAAYDREAINMDIRRLAGVRTVEQALDVANRSGIPHVNFVAGDEKGNIGWTIMGRIPKRIGFDGRTPTSWADGSHRWDGYYEPEETPRIVNPPSGRLWTANNRVVGGEMLEKIGWGNYDLGARARQIRDDLQARERFVEADMLAIQLDDRALFLERWRDLLLRTLDSDPKPNARRQELRGYLENWGERAVPESVGFRFVHDFRRRIQGQLTSSFIEFGLRTPSGRGFAGFHPELLHEWEAPIWALAQQQPPHLLPQSSQWSDWNGYLLRQADRMMENWAKTGKPLSEFTWGERNQVRIHHHFSPALPGFLQTWFNMPDQAIPGAWGDMPRVQTPNAGASQRMVVAPGKEERAIFHMPCGQSGHPLSSHYRDGHEDWAQGRPSSFLPGPTVHTLTLAPSH